ncbi:MAG: hypothetical protein ACOY9J_03350 [Pseudomonadota bacterium]
MGQYAQEITIDGSRVGVRTSDPTATFLIAAPLLDGLGACERYSTAGVDIVASGISPSPEFIWCWFDFDGGDASARIAYDRLARLIDPASVSGRKEM